ncbi:TPA: hypothetical protein ACNZ7E_005213, partial [Klebsiella quasipneumoniae subsp. similipneumoniae]
MKSKFTRRKFIKSTLSMSTLFISGQAIPKEKIICKKDPSDISFDTVDILRKHDPITDGERLYLKGIKGNNGSGYFLYDEKDKTSLDNGWFIIKTTTGKTLKREQLNERIELAWSGISSGDSIGKYWQQAIDFIDKIAQIKMSAFGLPIIYIPTGEFKLESMLSLPPYISNISNGNVKLTVDFKDRDYKSAILITNTNSVDYYKKNQSPHFPKTFSNIGGKLSIIHTQNRSENNPAGIITDAISEEYGPICMSISDIEFIGGWRAGHECNPINFWGAHFENCVFQGVNAIHYKKGNKDSGERISYVNCWFESSGQDKTKAPSIANAILIEASGMNLNFVNCSLDYNYGHVVTISKTASWSLIQFNSCHIENFGNFLVNIENNNVFENTHVTFRGCNILPNGEKISPSPSRKLFNGGGICHLDDSFISWTSYPYDALDGVLTKGSAMKVTTNKMKLINTRDIYFTRDAIVYEE